jgi:hypothetical protein
LTPKDIITTLEAAIRTEDEGEVEAKIDLCIAYITRYRSLDKGLSHLPGVQEENDPKA